MKLKEWFQNIKSKVKKLWDKTEEKVLEFIPIAVQATEGLKKAKDGPWDEVILTIVKNAIPGSADDLIIDKVNSAVDKYLPISIFNLKMINVIAGIVDPIAQQQAILAQFKLSDDETKSKAYHNFCASLIYAFADGKLSWGESFKLAEEGYEIYVLNKKE